MHVACVSYLNTRPLIAGLDADRSIRLTAHVPADLARQIETGAADVALLPTIDYQRLPNLRIIPAGGIGCDGPTLTVRLFSHEPFGRITTLACDPESHTSVALARIVLDRLFDVRPEFLSLRDAGPSVPRLLIGDKVVCEEPVEFAHQLDLGEAWKRLSGLPFVFAVWCAREGVDLRDLPAKLVAARMRGMADIDSIVERFALPRGWPAVVARRYLTQHLQFEIGERQLAAIRAFHTMAGAMGIVAAPVRPLSVIDCT